MPPLPNSCVPTAAIFEHPGILYKILETGEIYFQDPKHIRHIPRPEECTTARDLGLRINGSCVVRGPHVVHGYDDTVHGTVVNIQSSNGYDIVVVKLLDRNAQKDGRISTSFVERRFLMQWDEVGTEDVELKVTSANIIHNMLFTRVHLVPLLTRLVRKADWAVIDRVVWFPAISDTTGVIRDGEEHLGLTFVHTTPEHCPSNVPPEDIPLFATSIAWAHRASLRQYAAAQGQLFAADVFQTHFFRKPPLAIMADMLGNPQSLPLESPGADPARTQIQPHRRLGRALERMRTEGVDALDELFAASFVFNCPCLPVTPNHLERHCVCHS